MKKRRLVLFRVIAVLLGISPFVAFEGLCRLNGWGQPQNTVDPFIGFSDVHPLFERNSVGDRYEIPKSRQVFFRPESFVAEKAPNEFRVFCLGGSTVQGRPYAIETSFTTWLELGLQAADASRKWQVVNCGGVSYASYRLVPILREVTQYQPDLIVVYTGHNEFLEDRSYGDIRDAPKWRSALQESLAELHSYGVLRSCFRKSQPAGPNRPTLSAEVDALLDYQGGLASYHLDDPWHAGVIAHYEYNLRRMTRIANDARIPLVFANPISNLKDTPPFKCENQPTLDAEQREQFQRSWESAKSVTFDDVDRKISEIQRTLNVDSRYADAYFLLGRCYEAVDDWRNARAAYIRAKDEDLCPLRMLESMHEKLKLVARQTGTPLVDARARFESIADNGILGEHELIDHVHPRINGHQEIADMLLNQMVDMGFLRPQIGWQENQQSLYKHHFESLPAGYFPMGQERLNGLKSWAEGRVERIRQP